MTVRKEGSFRVECAVLCSEYEYDMNNVNLCRRRGGISSSLVTVLLSLDHRIIPRPTAAPSSFRGEKTRNQKRKIAIVAEARTRITKVRTRTKTKTLLYDDTPHYCMKLVALSLQFDGQPHTDLFPDATDTRDGCDVSLPSSAVQT